MQRLDKAAAAAGYGGGSRATGTPIMGGGGGQQGMSPYPTSPIGANIVIGGNAASSIDLYYGGQTGASTGRRIPGRYP
jgi:hypothetical protein